MPLPDGISPEEAARIKEVGKLLAPYLILHSAPQAAASRRAGNPLKASVKDARTHAIADSVEDAVALIGLVLK